MWHRTGTRTCRSPSACRTCASSATHTVRHAVTQCTPTLLTHYSHTVHLPSVTADSVHRVWHRCASSATRGLASMTMTGSARCPHPCPHLAHTLLPPATPRLLTRQLIFDTNVSRVRVQPTGHVAGASAYRPTGRATEPAPSAHTTEAAFPAPVAAAPAAAARRAAFRSSALPLPRAAHASVQGLRHLTLLRYRGVCMHAEDRRPRRALLAQACGKLLCKFGMPACMRMHMHPIGSERPGVREI